MGLVRIGGRFRLDRKLTSESAHDIYIAHDIFSGETVVVKLEPANKAETLDHEFRVYKNLRRGNGIPRTHWFGMEAGFDALVIERLGPSLDKLFAQHNFRFSLKTVLLLAAQLLRRLQFIHLHNVIHRDLKPSNIAMGIGKQANLVYIIDFGLSKEFRNPKTHAHIPFSSRCGFTGNLIFASINSHLGSQLGRRDDMESLAYLLIYFLRGSLPWQDAGEDILAIKQGITSEAWFQKLPMEFRTFLMYSRSLAFTDKPDYDYSYELFHNLLLREGFPAAFDWDVADK